ncbi:MAG: hypothetical protein M3N53_08100 [Actinomycetota bacterium]|nr:hypothetical protein [Actinomycetota bacterium]
MRIARTLTIVLVISLLVGASATASAKPARGGSSSADQLRFAEPVALESFSPLRTAVSRVYDSRSGKPPSDHEWSGEPVLQVDKKGVVYIAGTCCLAASSPVWRSTDGKKFTEMESPGHVREWGIGAEGDLAVDDEGNVYFVDTYIPGLLISKWSDHGQKWEYTLPTSGVIPGFDDRPWIAWSEKGLYLYVNHVSHTEVYRSTDGGKTWSTFGPLSWDGKITGQPYFPGHIAADRKTGTLWVAGTNADGQGSELLTSSVSTDQGKTFTEAVVTRPQRSGGFSPIFTGAAAVDAAGTGYVTWSTYDKEGCDVYYAYSSNNGKSWSDPIKASSGPGCATFPWITADGDGGVGLAWYQTPTTKKANVAQRFLRAATGGTTLYGGIDLPLAAYQDELPEDAPWYLHAAVIPKADTKRPRIYESRVPTETPVALGPLGRQLWDFLQLDIGPDGRLHITFASKFKDAAPQTYYVTNTGGPKL